jgi:hypothetical protein
MVLVCLPLHSRTNFPGIKSIFKCLLQVHGNDDGKAGGGIWRRGGEEGGRREIL